jgi:hypothetical protein
VMRCVVRFCNTPHNASQFVGCVLAWEFASAAADEVSALSTAPGGVLRPGWVTSGLSVIPGSNSAEFAPIRRVITSAEFSTVHTGVLS